jgi:hypothetical protein
MIPLTRDIAILDAHTRFTRLEIINDAPLLAAVGTAVNRCIFTIWFHPGIGSSNAMSVIFLRREQMKMVTISAWVK